MDERLTVITGGNGAGKSNLYRALRLLVDAADGNLGRALAREGGMPSALWAGAGRPTKPGAGTRLSIGFADELFAYELRLGLPSPPPPSPPPPFAFDPEVKEETIRTLARPRDRSRVGACHHRDVALRAVTVTGESRRE